MELKSWSCILDDKKWPVVRQNSWHFAFHVAAMSQERPGAVQCLDRDDYPQHRLGCSLHTPKWPRQQARSEARVDLCVLTRCSPNLWDSKLKSSNWPKVAGGVSRTIWHGQNLFDPTVRLQDSKVTAWFSEWKRLKVNCWKGASSHAIKQPWGWTSSPS